MKFNSSGIFVAMLILIIMLLICHTMNFLYPINIIYPINAINSTTLSKSYFNNMGSRVLPTQYNVITYNKQTLRKPCESHAQLPCKIINENCSTPTQQTTLSDSELILLYKEAYELAGQEILTRTLKK